MKDDGNEVSLMEAAVAIRASRERTLRMVLTGRLEGRRTATGWKVRRSSVDAVSKQMGRSAAVA